ncbi:MAG: hypothetical protein ABEJ55_08475 [Halanaeroarchaeum sp.]
MSASIRLTIDLLVALAFSRHVDAPRHAASRRLYQGLGGGNSFAVFLGRLYAVSWVTGFLGAVVTVLSLARVEATALRGIAATLATIPRGGGLGPVLVPLGGLLTGVATKRATIHLGERYLAIRVRQRRERIERTLPRATRFMQVLATDQVEEARLLESVAEREEAFGETARAFQRVIATAAVTGSVDTALRLVARDSPSRRTLAPFLLTFRARAREGPDALSTYLRRESRMLARSDAMRSGAAKRHLGLVVQLLLALLIVPVLLVAVGAGIGEFSPGRPFDVAGTIHARSLVTPIGAGFVLLLGIVATAFVFAVRPGTVRWSRHRRSDDIRALIGRAPINPTNALYLLAPVGPIVTLWATSIGTDPVTAAVVGLAAVGVPVGVVDWRRARLDAAKDRYLPEFIHEVGHQVHLGRSVAKAVERVSSDARLGPLDGDVADLAFDLRVATGDRPVRGAALDRFVARVGTPLARRTVGMIAGALDAGGQAALAHEALQSEAGRLYHEERAVRDRLPVVVAVGWIAAMLVVGIVVAIDVAALGSTVPTGGTGASETMVIPGVGKADLPPFYLLTQATMLTSGWFTGVAGRGAYEGLLHSSALGLVAVLAFGGAGLI